MRYPYLLLLQIIVGLFSASQAQGQTTLRYQHKKGDMLQYVFEQELTTTLIGLAVTALALQLLIKKSDAEVR